MVELTGTFGSGLARFLGLERYELNPGSFDFSGELGLPYHIEASCRVRDFTHHLPKFLKSILRLRFGSANTVLSL